jgi:ectoine hydroxylase-related dioxygenase (phytanoyl-CoA dioxygenase family)
VEILSHVLGPDFLLSSISANITAPGHGGMLLHCDQLFVPQPWPTQPQGVNVFWLLDDFTEANGGTLLAPGSHKVSRAPIEGQDDVSLVPLEAPAGTMVVMEGRVWHKTGRNRTADQRRAGVFGWYVAPIYRTQENWFLSLNPLILQSRPSERLLRMLGYRVQGMFFGHSNGYEPLPKALDFTA